MARRELLKPAQLGLSLHFWEFVVERMRRGDDNVRRLLAGQASGRGDW